MKEKGLGFYVLLAFVLALIAFMGFSFHPAVIILFPLAAVIGWKIKQLRLAHKRSKALAQVGVA